MDFIQDYLTLLPKLLPPSLASPLLTLLTTGFGIFRTIQTHITPLLIRLTTQPDVASVLALLVIFFISLKILDMAYRAVMFWVRLVFRLVVWGSLGIVCMWIWQRGLEGFFEDVQGLVEFWSGEYDKYSGEVKRWQQYEEAQVRAKSGKAGWKWR